MSLYADGPRNSVTRSDNAIRVKIILIISRIVAWSRMPDNHSDWLTLPKAAWKANLTADAFQALISGAATLHLGREHLFHSCLRSSVCCDLGCLASGVHINRACLYRYRLDGSINFMMLLSGSCLCRIPARAAAKQYAISEFCKTLSARPLLCNQYC